MGAPAHVPTTRVTSPCAHPRKRPTTQPLLTRAGGQRNDRNLHQSRHHRCQAAILHGGKGAMEQPNKGGTWGPAGQGLKGSHHQH